MIYINDKEVNFIYNLGEKVKEVFSYGTKIWPQEILLDYMYFKLADGETSGNVSYQFSEYYNLHNKYLKISTDGNNWSDWTEQISMVPNTKYYVLGEDSYVRNSDINSGFFSSDVSVNQFSIECGGNVMSLVNMNENITTNYCFCTLFKNITNLLTPPKLPATTLSDSCYNGMFRGCSSLTQAPALPATTLADYCYNYMFNGCTSLTQAPVLPATTLASSCYYGMFSGCTSLTQAHELPATKLADSCYYFMFNGCRSLTQAPELPATKLANNCYYFMFKGCISLTQAPVLPATTLASSCYASMFYGCSKLTQAPALPATTLASNCYYGMFFGCRSLTQVPELPATTLAYYCYQYMFQDCTSLTQAPVLPATTLTSSCYNGMFSDCSSLIEAPELPAINFVDSCYTNMFKNCSSLNWIKALFTNAPSPSYTRNWVYDVSSQGVFVKNIDATWTTTTTGADSIPHGWTVIYFDQTEGKYYTTRTKEKECDKYGNVKQEIDAMYFKLADGETSGNVSYQFSEYYNLHNKYLKISTDGSNWTDWTEAISMSPNVKYYVKGEDDYVRNSNISSGFFSSDVSQNQFNIKCGGNIMSLVNMNENITTNYCFCSLFKNMRNLLTPPELPATTLADFCYYFMFKGCKSLTQAPALPATTLKNYCYDGMFSGCYSLTQAPELPATTLAYYCYQYMFQDCTSLTQAPELPATTLKRNCYNGMFNNANNLNWIKALFTNAPSRSYTGTWVQYVSSQGVFVKNINATWTTTGVDAVPTGWTVIYFDKTEGKYYTTRTKEKECDKYGNPL